MPLESKASMHASGIKQICFVNNNVNMLRDFIVFSALIKIYRCRNTVDPQSLFSKGVLIFSFFSLEFSFFRSSRGWGGSLVAPLLGVFLEKPALARTANGYCEATFRSAIGLGLLTEATGKQSRTSRMARG